MQLLPCTRPVGSLESAPRTALRADSVDERWEGFWCVANDSYYTRCTRIDGSEQWFRIADEFVRIRDDEADRIIALRASRENVDDARHMLLLRRANGQPILVGSLRRKVGASR